LKILHTLRGFLAPFLFLFSTVLFADFVIVNEEIIDDRAILKIKDLGIELQDKAGISVYISAQVSLKGKTIKEYEQAIASTLKAPYVLLSFARNETKVDIINSDGIDELFDKEQILSPFPWSGTIIPLLSMHGKDLKAQESAAMLNGYADIVEQIAKSKGIELQGAIGSENQNVYSLLKIIFYGTIFVAVGLWLRRKYRKKG
jgi:hypothetical protein